MCLLAGGPIFDPISVGNTVVVAKEATGVIALEGPCLVCMTWCVIHAIRTDDERWPDLFRARGDSRRLLLLYLPSALERVYTLTCWRSIVITYPSSSHTILPWHSP